MSVLDNSNVNETITERKLRENDGTMVTVICITYNHEKYIAEALESFVTQKTNFKFKVFVGDDCSSDGTSAIVREYANKYPDIIIPFIREANMGGNRNAIDLCQRASSPYIAFCEGDDYWIDDYKLQKQFDFMSKNNSLRACFHSTEMYIEEGFEECLSAKNIKTDSNGCKLMPEGLSSFSNYKNKYIFSIVEFIPECFIHTSSVFYKWNYDIDYPDWFFDSFIGDYPLFIMQVGDGEFGRINEVMSVYRRNREGIYSGITNQTDFFLDTRPLFCKLLLNISDYLELYYDDTYKVIFENRIKIEFLNYMNVLIDIGDYETLCNFIIENKRISEMTLKTMSLHYWDIQKMGKAYSYPVTVKLARNENFKRIFKKVLKHVLKLMNILIKIIKWYRGFRSLLKYWGNALVPKQKNLWVFSEFKKVGYQDNGKYLYDYILEHHPEINAVWLTQDNDVLEKLKSKDMPVFKMSSPEGKKCMKKAAIAVVNHYKVTDYENNFGFNARTKVVQLWHGVGLKSMQQAMEISSFKRLGFRSSEDIVSFEDDKILIRIKKQIKYLRHAHHRELFEKYFMLLIPGQERIDMVAKVFRTPEDRWFRCGHPRNILLHQSSPDWETPKILYAPTYRESEKYERSIVESCLEALPEIQALMEQISGEFTIRLHPHTWRNYNRKIERALLKYNRIHASTEKDIYQTLGNYAMIISDYSSIAYDFVMLDRPVIFHCPDLDIYLSKEAGIGLDYKEVTPGPKTKNWHETLNEIRIYSKCPEKDSKWRQDIRSYFFDMEVNDKDNSERIVKEIKRRIGL